MDNITEMLDKAHAGDIEAQYKAATYIIYDIEPEKCDSDLIERAIGYLKNAAMNNYFHGLAATVLADLYYDGKYVDQDFRAAILWYRTSILAMNPVGYFGMGRCYYHGHGVAKDYARAFDNFSRER